MRLTSPCAAGGMALHGYKNAQAPDERGVAPCPVCGKPCRPTLRDYPGNQRVRVVPHHNRAVRVKV